MDMHYTIEGLCHLNTSQNVKQIDKLHHTIIDDDL